MEHLDRLTVGAGWPHLLEQLPDVVKSLRERAAPFGGGVIPSPASPLRGALTQISPLGQPVQERVESARAYRVSVAAKLFDESKAINVFFGRVMQHVKLYQTAPEIAMTASWTGTHQREHISGRRPFGRRHDVNSDAPFTGPAVSGVQQVF
jgi:hypothetical protein